MFAHSQVDVMTPLDNCPFTSPVGISDFPLTTIYELNTYAKSVPFFRLI